MNLDKFVFVYIFCRNISKWLCNEIQAYKGLHVVLLMVMICSIINDAIELSDSIKSMEYFDYFSDCDRVTVICGALNHKTYHNT